MSIIFSIWTVVVFILFIAIALWAWSGKNKARFDDASRIPFEEDEQPSSESSNEVLKHG